MLLRAPMAKATAPVGSPPPSPPPQPDDPAATASETAAVSRRREAERVRTGVPLGRAGRDVTGRRSGQWVPLRGLWPLAEPCPLSDLAVSAGSDSRGILINVTLSRGAGAVGAGRVAGRPARPSQDPAGPASGVRS